MKISIGCDHAGYEYKDNIVKYLEKQGQPYRYQRDMCQRDWPLIWWRHF